MFPLVLLSGFCQHFHLDYFFSFSHIWPEVAALFPALQGDNYHKEECSERAIRNGTFLIQKKGKKVKLEQVSSILYVALF
jgi:hypothetical protein